MSGGLIILEGADGSGKTTLAKRIVKETGGVYLHSGPHKDQWTWNAGSLLYVAKLLAQDKFVVVDRHWMSNLVYGPIYMDHIPMSHGSRAMDRMFLRMGALNVLCVPSDVEAQIERVLGKKSEGHHEEFESNASKVREVCCWYQDAAWGNIARGGLHENYLSTFWRYAGLDWREDVKVYDLDPVLKNPKSYRFSRTCRSYIAEAQKRHSKRWGTATSVIQYPNLGGDHLTAKILMVGDTHSAAVHPKLQFPFFSHRASSDYLHAALDRIGICETQLLWTEVNHPNTWVKHIQERGWRPKRVVVLGDAAAKGLDTLAPNLLDNAMVVKHPSWYMRFDHHGDSCYSDLVRALGFAASPNNA